MRIRHVLVRHMDGKIRNHTFGDKLLLDKPSGKCYVFFQGEFIL